MRRGLYRRVKRVLGKTQRAMKEGKVEEGADASPSYYYIYLSASESEGL